MVSVHDAAVLADVSPEPPRIFNTVDSALDLSFADRHGPTDRPEDSSLRIAAFMLRLLPRTSTEDRRLRTTSSIMSDRLLAISSTPSSRSRSVNVETNLGTGVPEMFASPITNARPMTAFEYDTMRRKTVYEPSERERLFAEWQEMNSRVGRAHRAKVENRKGRHLLTDDRFIEPTH